MSGDSTSGSPSPVAYPDELLARYKHEVLRALSARLIDGEDALELLISPSERVLEMMAEEAA